MSKKRIVRWTICFAVITALTVVFFILELVSGHLQTAVTVLHTQ